MSDSVPLRLRLLGFAGLGLFVIWGLFAFWMSPVSQAATPVKTPTPRFVLGKALFFEPLLSRTGTKSCGSCHDPNLAFVDRYRRGLGLQAEVLAHNTPSLINVQYFRNFNWGNPTLTVLEKQFEGPLFGQHPPEMGAEQTDTYLQTRLKDIPEYQTMFKKAFPNNPEAMTWTNALAAIGEYTRALTSFNSPYDRYQRGDKRAMSAAALRGEQLFLSDRLKCATCHPAPHFTDNVVGNPNESFYNIGLYNIGGTGNYPEHGQGAFVYTNNPADRGKYRTPSLRNALLTPPYMHDGSIATLTEVIKLFEQGGRNITYGAYVGDGRANPNKSTLIQPFTLTDAERSDLLAFLYALTDSTVLTNPAFLRSTKPISTKTGY